MGREFSLADLADEDVLDAHVPAIGRSSAPVKQACVNPGNPRRQLGDVSELAKAMAEVGQLQPVTVVHAELYLQHFPEHAAQVGAAELVAITGARRIKAAISLGWDTIDITVKDNLAESRAKLLAAALMENIDRRDLDLIDEADAVDRLITELGNAEAAGRQLGKSRQWAQQRADLLRLVDELQELVRQGDLRFTLARELSALPPVEQVAAWKARSESSRDSKDDQGDTAVSPPHQRKQESAERIAPPMVRAMRKLGKTSSDRVDKAVSMMTDDEIDELIDFANAVAERRSASTATR